MIPKFVAAAALASALGAGWITFRPAKDDFRPNALDMSRFVDAPTGAHGFLTTRNGAFVFEDGTPARFWGAQIDPFSKEEIDYAVRRMRRQGINVTRLHGLEFLTRHGAKSIFDYDKNAFDHLDYLIAKLGENGIYLILDVDYPLILKFGPEDHVPSANGEHSRFIDDKVAAMLHRRMADVFTHFNPYTKKRYADDPTLALVEVLNEDSLFWGELAEPWRTELEKKFGEWRGAPAKLIPAPQLSSALKDPAKAKVAREQMRFFLDLEERYWKASREAMRKAGIKVPIAATNWQGSDSLTTRVHMLGQSKMDYLDRHGYWDHPSGEGDLKWRIATARFHNQPMIKAVKPDQDRIVYLGVGNLVTEKAWERIFGMPMTVSEWNTCLPNEYSLEGTGLMAAYGLMQGWSGSLEFGYFSPDFRESLSDGSFDMLGNQAQILQFPAAAAMWHRGDVREADVVAESLYDPETVFGAEPDRKPLPLAAALVGKVGYRFVEKQRSPVVKDIASYWNPRELVARSMTGELSWDARNGVVHVDTPRTQAVIGYLGAHPHSLRDVRLESSNRFGAVWVTAIDGEVPVHEARRLLVTAVGPARNTGMEYEQTSEASRMGPLWRLKAEGTAPALLEDITGKLVIRSSNAAALKAWTLDIVGRRTGEAPLTRDGDSAALDLHGSVYYELGTE